MNAQEIIAKVSKYKEMLEAESDSDIRARYQKKIKELEASLEEVEKKVEKLEEKVATEEKKELSEAEKKIRKYQDFLDNESDPDLKARYQKKIKELQDSLKEVKAEIKKAAKVVKAAKATKVERKEAVKKVEKKVRERKEVSVKRTRRGKKIKEIIDELDKLIAKNKKLKEKYAGKGVDVKRDAGRSAKPFGYRFVGKHDYRVPTADQIKKGKKRGTIDYEGRPNRSDVYPKRAAKLADGGMIDRRYIVLRIADMMRSYFEFEKENLKEQYEIENSKFQDLESGDFDTMKIERDNDVLIIEKDKEDYITFNGKKYHNKDLFKKGDKYYFADSNKTYSFQPRGDEGARWGLEGQVHAIGTDGLDPTLFIYMFGISWDEKMKNAQKTLAFLKKEAENNPSPKMKKSVSNFEEYIKKLNQNKYAKGGKVGHSKEDKARFAKPAGWRWKEIAVTKRIIERKQLSMQPSKKMRDKYPDYVYYEDRLNKADKKPSRKYLSE